MWWPADELHEEDLDFIFFTASVYFQGCVGKNLEKICVELYMSFMWKCLGGALRLRRNYLELLWNHEHVWELQFSLYFQYFSEEGLPTQKSTKWKFAFQMFFWRRVDRKNTEKQQASSYWKN